MLDTFATLGFPSYRHYYGLVRPLYLSTSFAVCVLFRFGSAI